MEEPTDRSYRSRAIRVGEETYRKIRIALEENREYRVANDFYYREMTYRYKGAHKIKREFTVSALYGHLSVYGVRPLRAFTVLLILVGVHALGTGAISGVFTSSLDLSHTAETVQGVLASALRSLQIMSFQRVPPEPNIGQGFIDVLMRILGAVQIALFSLALRNQTRR